MPEHVVQVPMKPVQSNFRQAPQSAQPYRADSMPLHVDLHQHELPEVLDRRLAMLRNPRSKAADTFRTLRHKLRLAGDPAVVAVASARRREGRTTCAVNLALAMAEDQDTRVLLLEADVRNPSLAALLQLPPQGCVAKRLSVREQSPNRWSVTKLGGSSLHVSHVATDGHQLQRRAVADALFVLKQSYDYVVVDTPPVLHSADALLVGESCDSFLVVTRAAKSSQKELAAMLEQLSPMPVVGAVLMNKRI